MTAILDAKGPTPTPDWRWHASESLPRGYRMHLVAVDQPEARAVCGRRAPIAGWRIHDYVELDRNPLCRVCEERA